MKNSSSAWSKTFICFAELGVEEFRLFSVLQFLHCLEYLGGGCTVSRMAGSNLPASQRLELLNQIPQEKIILLMTKMKRVLTVRLCDKRPLCPHTSECRGNSR